MSFISKTALTWVDGSDPELTASNVQDIDDSVEAAARLAGSIPQSVPDSLVVRSSTDADEEDTIIQLFTDDYLVMDDGECVNGWNGEECDISATGAGGIETGSSRATDTWYSLYAIRVQSADTKALIAAEATSWSNNTSHETNDGSVALGDAAARDKLAQGFQLSSAGSVRFVDLYLKKTLSPTDYLTVTIESDSGGDPDGTPLGTGRVLSQARIGTSLQWVRVIFDTAVSLAATTQYHLVLDRSGAADAANYLSWGNDSGAGYGSGTLKSYDSGGASWSDTTTDADFRVWLEVEESWSLPGSYDQKCLVAYFRTNATGSGNLVRFKQHGRKLKLYDLPSATSTSSSVPTLVDDSYLPPAPCIMYVGLDGNAGAATQCKVAGVEDGYYLWTTTAEDAGGVETWIGSGINAGAPVVFGGRILTQYQSYYVAEDGGNSADFWAIAAEWI